LLQKVRLLGDKTPKPPSAPAGGDVK